MQAASNEVRHLQEGHRLRRGVVGPFAPDDTRGWSGAEACPGNVGRVDVKGDGAREDERDDAEYRSTPYHRSHDHNNVWGRHAVPHPRCGPPAIPIAARHLVHWIDGGRTEVDRPPPHWPESIQPT